jgi:hypothetical protein
MRQDVTFPLYVEVDEIYNLACPASPILRRSGLTARWRLHEFARICREH